MCLQLQLLAAESDYKLLNEKFIAMKSVLSLQAEKIRVQRQLLKATVNSHTGSSPAGGDEGQRFVVIPYSVQPSSENLSNLTVHLVLGENAVTLL